jgi:hypothetical protein
VIKSFVVIDFFVLNVDQHTSAQFTTSQFVSSMELGPRSPRNAFGAARHTIPFDRVNGYILVGYFCLFYILFTSTCERANNNPPNCLQDGARACL